MTTTTNTPTKLPSCPAWCEVDHEQQQRMLDRTARFPEDREPFHHRLLAEGFDTDTHGPVYKVALERSGGGTRLYVDLQSIDLSADQAEAFGLALVRGAHILRTCGDASDEVTLRQYQGAGGKWMSFEPQVLESTKAERALGAA